MKRLGLWVGGLLCAVIAIIAAVWAFGAVWFDGPFGAGNKIATALLADYDSSTPIALYVIAAAVLTVLAVELS